MFCQTIPHTWRSAVDVLSKIDYCLRSEKVRQCPLWLTKSHTTSNQALSHQTDQNGLNVSLIVSKTDSKGRFLAPSGAQRVTMFVCFSVSPLKLALKPSHASSGKRRLKYFVLLKVALLPTITVCLVLYLNWHASKMEREVYSLFLLVFQKNFTQLS